ncbi:unnamed protein product [Ectocarpus sp. 12 AP-2014]
MYAFLINETTAGASMLSSLHSTTPTARANSVVSTPQRWNCSWRH